MGKDITGNNLTKNYSPGYMTVFLFMTRLKPKRFVYLI
jgi:hypothetical protein